MDRLQQPAREQPGELACTPRIGLDPIARPLRHQPRRHHAAIETLLDRVTVETKAGRTRLRPAGLQLHPV